MGKGDPKELPRIVESEFFAKRYQFRRVIGRGGFGLVLEVEALEEKRRPLALKIVKCGPECAQADRYVSSEIAIHGKVAHASIVRFLGVDSAKQYRRTRELAFLELELMAGGSLGAFIRRKKSLGEPVTELAAKRLLRQVLAGLQYLHQRRIIHRDIKPENILVDDATHPTVAKITDFGISAKLNLMLEDGLQLQCGTHVFKSPEQLCNEVYSKVTVAHQAADLWGLGLVTFMLLFQGRHPFVAAGSQDAAKQILENELVFPEPGASRLARDFISKLLRKDQYERYSAAEAAEHPWLRDDEAGDIPLSLSEKFKMFEARIALRQVPEAHQCFTLAVVLQKLRSEEEKPIEASRQLGLRSLDRGTSIGRLTLAELSSSAEPKSLSIFQDGQGQTETAQSLTPQKIAIRMSNRTVFHKREEATQFREALPARRASKPASKSSTNKRANAIRTSLIMSNIHSILKRLDQPEDRRADSQARVKLAAFVQTGARRVLEDRKSPPGCLGTPAPDFSDRPASRSKHPHTDATQLRAGILKLSRKARQGSQPADKENASMVRSLKRAESGILPDVASSTNLAAHSAFLHQTMSAKHRASKTPLHELHNMTNLFDSSTSKQLALKTPGVAKKEGAQVLVKTKKYLIKSNSNYIDGFG